MQGKGVRKLAAQLESEKGLEASGPKKNGTNQSALVLVRFYFNRMFPLHLFFKISVISILEV